jgi:4-hydroxybenzoate polyprenyltransferase
MLKKFIGILKLMRMPHYVKNGLIFLPLFFSIKLFNPQLFLKCVLGAVAFSFISSVVYIINDIRDKEKDSKHSKKCKRPIASGLISVPLASAVAVILSLISAAILYLLGSWLGAVFAILYVIVNIAYSFGAKNVPILDLILLVSGFVIRLLFGGVIIGVAVSTWLFVTVICAAFYMGFGKRRGEILRETENTREVNSKYPIDFLDQQMSVFMTLILVFYSLWCIATPSSNFANPGFEWSVIIVMLIFVRYSYNVRLNSDGDPINVLLKDPLLISLVIIYCAFIFISLYVPVPLFHKIAELI